MSFRRDYIWAGANDGVFADQHNKSERHSKVDEVTRHELDAKLATVEAKMDARLARMEAVVERTGEDVKAVSRESANFKWWAIGTALAAVVGLYGANVSLLSGFVAAWESGRNVGQQQQSANTPPTTQKQNR